MKNTKNPAMHRIVQSHIESFAKQQGIEGDTLPKKFEKFSNYSILSPRTSSTIDIDEITTNSGEDGIDGVAVIIDEEIITSVDDAIARFSSPRRNRDVEIVLIQSKTSESFDLGDFLKFKEAIIRLVSLEPKLYDINDEVLTEANAILNVILRNVGKVRNGKPNIVIRYVTTGIYRQPKAFEDAISTFYVELEELGFFNMYDIKCLDRESLTKLWVSTYTGTSAEIEMYSLAPLPAIDGINEAYIGVVSALEVVNQLLMGDDGGVKSQVFEENVRSFLGSENPVNAAIAETITRGTGSSRFPVLNNGITIVSPNVIVQGSKIHLENYQIVNGCQTSHVLWENRDLFSKEIMVNLKVVETEDEDIFAELVRATNSQSKVEEKQFYSLRPIIKKVEKYFDSYEGIEARLYFERRDRQFVGKDVPAVRTFNLNTAAKCVCSMFLQRPDLASRYTSRMYDEHGEQIFHDSVKEIVFYTACLALYRIHLLVSNGTIPQNMRKFKWHLLPLVRAIASGSKEVYPVNSNRTEKQCESILKLLSNHNKKGTEIIKEAANVIESIDNLTRDRLKRQAIVQEMLSMI